MFTGRMLRDACGYWGAIHRRPARRCSFIWRAKAGGHAPSGRVSTAGAMPRRYARRRVSSLRCALALRNISSASRFSRSRAIIFSAMSLGIQGRGPLATSALFTRSLSVSAVQPILAAIEQTVVHRSRGLRFLRSWSHRQTCAVHFFWRLDLSSGGNGSADAAVTLEQWLPCAPVGASAGVSERSRAAAEPATK